MSTYKILNRRLHQLDVSRSFLGHSLSHSPRQKNKKTKKTHRHTHSFKPSSLFPLEGSPTHSGYDLSKQALLCLSHLFLCSLPLSACSSPHPNSSQFRLGRNHCPLRPLEEPLCSRPHSQIPTASNLPTPCHQSNLLKACIWYDPESFCSQKTRFCIFITGDHAQSHQPERKNLMSQLRACLVLCTKPVSPNRLREGTSPPQQCKSKKGILFLVL